MFSTYFDQCAIYLKIHLKCVQILKQSLQKIVNLELKIIAIFLINVHICNFAILDNHYRNYHQTPLTLSKNWKLFIFSFQYTWNPTSEITLIQCWTSKRRGANGGATHKNWGGHYCQFHKRYYILSLVIDQKGSFFPMADYRAPISALFSGRCHKSRRVESPYPCFKIKQVYQVSWYLLRKYFVKLGSRHLKTLPIARICHFKLSNTVLLMW